MTRLSLRPRLRIPGNLGLSALLGRSRVVTPYLGQVATRTLVPNAFLQSWPWKQNRRAHFARQAITGLQVVFANFFVNSANGGFTLNIESGPGAASSVTASIEYPAGTFTQVKFSASATGTIPNGGILVSDQTAVSIPAGAQFFVNQWENCSVGFVYNAYNVNPKWNTLDFFQFSQTALTDQTMTGISSSTSPSGSSTAGCAAIIATTTKPSVYLLGDSRMSGYNDLADSSLDVGEIARTLGPSFAYINGGIGGNRASTFVTSHSNQALLMAYCSHIVCELGVNDIYVDLVTSAQLATSRQSILSIIGAGKPTFETTLPPETNSTDAWATTVNQTATSAPANTQRGIFNTSVKAGTAGMAGYFDIDSATSTSGVWTPPGYTTDGIHETQLANLAIQSSGVINPALFHRP